MCITINMVVDVFFFFLANFLNIVFNIVYFSFKLWIKHPIVLLKLQIFISLLLYWVLISKKKQTNNLWGIAELFWFAQKWAPPL